MKRHKKTNYEGGWYLTQTEMAQAAKITVPCHHYWQNLVAILPLSSLWWEKENN